MIAESCLFLSKPLQLPRNSCCPFPIGEFRRILQLCSPALWAAWSKCRAQQAKAFMASSASLCPEEKGDALKTTGSEVSFLPCTFFDSVGGQALPFKDEWQGPPLSAFLPLVHQLFLCDMSFPNSVKIKSDTALITGLTEVCFFLSLLTMPSSWNHRL